MVFSILDDVSLHTEVRIDSVELEPELVKWLEAVGLERGATVRILRRASFGGPLHLRSSTGNEIALHRSLAKHVRVTAVLEPTTERARTSDGPSVRKIAELDLHAVHPSGTESTA